MSDNYQTIEKATIEATTEAIKETGKRYVTAHNDFACKHGLNVAILFDKLVRLHEYIAGKFDENGNHWVRMTLDEWEKEFPFWSRNTVDRTINLATKETKEKKPVILTRTFTGRSKWYRCNPEFLEPDQNVSPQNGDIQHPKMGSQSPQNGELPNSFPDSVPNSPPTPPKPKPKPQKPSVIPAYKIYTAVMGANGISKTWIKRMDSIVGCEPDKLEFWEQVLTEWDGLGWSRKNIKGQLDVFQSGKLPGNDKSQDNNGTPHHQDMTPEKRAAMEALNQQEAARPKANGVGSPAVGEHMQELAKARRV